MERVNLPLSEMTVSEKLDLIEAIWDDIAKNERPLESPGWHAEILGDRQKAHDWEEAKQRIRRNVS